MNWFQELKQRFSLRKIRNLARKNTVHREFIDIDKAARIGIIVNAGACTKADLKLLREYLLELQAREKQVLLIELNFTKNSLPKFADLFNLIFINPAKLNWLGHPNPDVENQLKQKELDILMDFDLSDRITSKYICSVVHAKTRTGAHDEGFENCYELMVDVTDDNRVGTMIREFDYFLKMIEK
jgi:hypothetical protein